MSKAKVTMIGLYHFNEDLFSQMVLPDGVESELLKNIILDESADFEVIYADPFFTENMIGLISRKWARTFQKWYDALQLEYDPIENYNRYEHWTDDSNRTGTDTGTINNAGTDTGTVNTDTSANSEESSRGNGQTDTYVNTYDSDSLHQNGESKSTQTASSNGKDTGNTLETRNLANGNLETRNLADSDTSNAVHDGRIHGNIGVTTSQQMLLEELNIDGWNLYEHIANVFIQELCIMVY